MLFRRSISYLILVCLSLNAGAQSPLFKALEKGDTVSVRHILEEDPTIDLTEKYKGFQPLHYASRDNMKSCVELLIEKGAPVDGKGLTTDEGEWTPLMLAVHNGYFEITKMLDDAGASWHWKNEQGVSPITLANKRADFWINLLRRDKETAWARWRAQGAVDKNNLSDLQEIIGEYGFERVALGSFDWPLICFAARDNKQPIVEFLAKRPGQVNQKTEAGWTPLMLAVINNHTEVCYTLVRNGADLLPKDSSGKTAVAWAQELALTHLLEIFADPEKGIQTYERNLKLFKAIDKGSLTGVKSAIKDGADINAFGSSNYTPLAAALYKNSPRIAAYLLSEGADPEKQYGYYQNRTTVAYDAAKYGMNEFIILLSRYGVALNKTNGEGKLPAEIAKENKYWWTAKIITDSTLYYPWKAFNAISNGYEPDSSIRVMLLGNKRLLNTVDENGNTLLHHSILKRSTEWLQFLVEAGADAAITNNEDLTAQEIADDADLELYTLYFEDAGKAARYQQLFKAIREKQTQRIPQLLKGLDINFKNGDGLNALHLAITTSQDSLVAFLLRSGADPDLQTDDGKSPAELAAINNDYNSLLAIEAAGATIKASELLNTESHWIKNHLADPVKTKKQFLIHRQLCEASAKGDSLGVLKALALGAQPNIHGQGGLAPLHLAASAGHVKVIKLLVEKGASRTIEALGTLKTPKMLAALNKQYEVLRYLGFDTVDLFQKDWKGVTLDDLARLDEKVLDIRLRHSADAFLFMLATDGDLDDLKSHEENIVDINVRDRDNETFLIKAVRAESYKTVEWLLKKGADPSINPGSYSRTALAVAAGFGNYRICRLLSTYQIGRACREAAAKEAKANGYSEISKWIAGDQKAAVNLELLDAVRNGDTAKVVKALLAKADPEVRIFDSTGFTPLHFASRSGQDEIVIALLKAGASVNNPAYAGDHLYTPLMLAAFNDHFTTADLLLQKGADPDWKNDVDTSARDIAAMRSPFIKKLLTDKVTARKEYREHKMVFDLIALQNINGLRKAIEENIPFEHTDEDDFLPIHRAVEKGSMEMTKILLEKNNINAVSGGLTPLAVAVLKEDLNMTIFLIENKADAQVKLSSDSTIIEMAEARELGEFVSVLNGNVASVRDYEDWKQSIVTGDTATFFAKLKQGLDVKKKMLEGYTMLHYAARQGADEMVKALIAASADVDLLTDNRWTPLMLAANNGHWRTVYLLLNNGADKKLENEDGKNAGDLALIRGHKLVKELVDAPELVYNQLSLIEAVKNKASADVESLLKKNIAVDFEVEDNWTALHYAIRSNLKDITAMLLRRGADAAKAAITNEGPYTPLMLAATNNFPEIIKLLMDFGADPMQMAGNENAISIAKKDSAYWCEQILKDGVSGYRRYQLSLQLRNGILKDDVVEIQEAVFNGASRDEQFEDGIYPLHLAIRENRTAAISYLLRNKPDLKKEASWGATPLMLAAYNGLHKVAADLIRSGADPYHKNSSGVTALDFAKEKGYPEFENLFKDPQQFIRQLDLLEAVRNSDISTVRELIRQNVDVNAPLCKERPLVVAVRDKNVLLTEILLQAKADPELRDRNKDKPVLIATRFDSAVTHRQNYDLAPFRIFHLLLSNGAKTISVDSLEQSLQQSLKDHPISWYAERLKTETALDKVVQSEKLLAAVKTGDEKKLLSLLSAGNNAIPDAFGNSLLTYTIYNHSASLAAALLNAGETAGLYHSSAMEAAAAKDAVVLIRQLKQKGYSLDEEGINGETPLTSALNAGEYSIARSIVELGANPNKKNKAGETPLEIAARSYYSEEAVAALLKAGANPNVPSGNSFKYPIIHAKDSVITSMLIKHGANVNVRDREEWTPLMEGISRSNRAVVNMLIKAGADVNATAFHAFTEKTPFMLAVELDDFELAVILAEAGADLYKRTRSGESAYSLAQANKNQRMLRLLIDPAKNKYDHYFSEAITAKDTTLALEMLRKGADINHQDKEGRTVLHTMVNYLKPEELPVVFFLLDHGARYDLHSKDGQTVLDKLIVEKNAWNYGDSAYEVVIESILRRGYDINLQNEKKITALERAVEGNDLKLAKKFIEAGARTDLKNVHGETVYDIAAANGNRRMKEVLDGKFDPVKERTYEELYDEYTKRPVDNHGNLSDLLLAEKAMDAVRMERKAGSKDYLTVLYDYVFALSFNNRLSEALVAAEEYTRLAVETENTSYDVREIYRVQQLLYSNSGNINKAIEATKKALGLITVDGREKMETYRTLAALYPDSIGTHYYELALDQLKKQKYDTVTVLETKADYAIHLFELKDPQGLAMLREIEKEIIDSSAYTQLAKAVYPEIALHEIKSGDRKRAYEIYEKLKARKDRDQLSYILEKLALKLGEEKEAEAFMKEAKKTALNALSADYIRLQYLLTRTDTSALLSTLNRFT